jgi:hypothetical protein
MKPTDFKITMTFEGWTTSIETKAPVDIHEHMQIIKALLASAGYTEAALNEYFNNEP